MSSPLPTIACKECGHVNEGERVYCHNCGNKLDRSILLTAQKQEVETPEEKTKRVQKMMNPNAGLLGRGWWKTALKTVVWAVVAAALVDMALPPEKVPPMPKLVDAPPLGMALENIAASRTGQHFKFTQDEINNYLQKTVVAKKEATGLAGVLKFQRVFTNLEAGAIRITTQNALYDYPLYAGFTYQLKVENEELKPVVMGGNLGRLQIAAPAVRYCTSLFAPVWDSLKHETKLMSQMSSVEIKEGEMIVAGPAPGAKSAPGAPPAVGAVVPPPVRQ